MSIACRLCVLQAVSLWLMSTFVRKGFSLILMPFSCTQELWIELSLAAAACYSAAGRSRNAALLRAEVSLLQVLWKQGSTCHLLQLHFAAPLQSLQLCV